MKLFDKRFSAIFSHKIRSNVFFFINEHTNMFTTNKKVWYDFKQIDRFTQYEVD